MFRCLIITALLMHLSSSSILLPNENFDNDMEVVNFAIRMVNECVECETLLIIYTENEYSSNIVLKNISIENPNLALFTIKIKNYTAYQDLKHPGHKPDMTIIFLNEDNYLDLEDIIYGIEEEQFWYIRNKFLVVITGETADDDEWIQKTYEAFWDMQVLRVLIVFWKEELRVYAYNPFLEDYGTEVTNRPDLQEIFEHRITNMNGYTIKAYHFDVVMREVASKVIKNGKETWVGSDGLVYSTITESLNATLEVHFVSEDVDEQLINDADISLPLAQFIKVFTDIYDFDTIFNAMRTYTDNELDHIFMYERNDMYIVIPRAKQMPRYVLLFQIVPANVWAATFVSMGATSLMMYLIQKYNSKKPDSVNIFLDNYRLLLNESTPDRNWHEQERLLILLWIFLTIVFGTLFQSVYTSSLVTPKYYPEIDTLQDLYKTDFKVYTAKFSYIHVTRMLSDENIKLMNHLVLVPKNITVYGEHLDWIANYRHDNLGFMLSHEQIIQLKRYDTATAGGEYHVMKESPMPNAVSYNIRKNKLYYKEFMKILNTIQEAGLHYYWRRYGYFMKPTSIDNNSTVHVVDEDNEGRALTLEHLQSGFILLAFGYSAAFIAFCCEMMCHRKK